MDKDQSAVSQFLENNEEQNLFEKDSENPFETQEVVEPKEEVVEEKPLPFNRDPKVMKFIEKEISKRMTREEPAPVSHETEDEFKSVVDSFTAIIGNDTPEKVNALNSLQRALGNLDQRAAQKATEAIEAISQREEEADREAEDELESAFESIEENYDVDFSRNPKLRSEFATFVEKIAPKDRNGEVVDYPDMTSAWETFSEMRNANRTPSRAKELASRGMTRSSATEATAPTKRITFDDFDNLLSGN